MKAAIYTRISSRDRQGDNYSLDAQEAACRSLAKRQGWEVVEVFTDQKSGSTMERPDFQGMLRQAQARRFDVLIVHKLDRFSRSIADQSQAFDMLDEAGVRFVSVTEGEIDFSVPSDVFQTNMLGSVNQFYLHNLSLETSKGLKARAKAGMWLGEVPFGYDCNYKQDGGDGKAFPDEHEADGVRMAFEKYATGMYSYRDVAELLNEAGYRPRGRGERALRLFSKDTVNVMLTNRFYIGEVQYKGEHYPGVHEPIISEELFNRVQDARAARYHGQGTSAPTKSRVYPLTGVARCARCDNPMRGSSSSGLRYYRDPARDQCRDCDQGLVRSVEAEDAVGEHLAGLTLPSDWKEQILDIIREKAESEENARQKREQWEGQLERLKRLFKFGDISEQEYKQERDELRARLRALKPPEMPDLEDAARLLENIGLIWDEATLKEEKQIVHTLLEAVYLDSEVGPVVSVKPKAEFRVLFELASDVSFVEGAEPRRDDA
jgi:DNA invertase Pin-like site-specific DNA recombinase